MIAERISVVIPVRDGERYLAEALDSVLMQDDPPAEVIVVDDGSTDATPEILARYGDPVVVLTSPPVGQAAALNAGLRRASGELLAFLDADDRMTPGSLRVRRAALVPEVDGVFGAIRQFLSPDADPARRFRFDAGPQRSTLLQSLVIRRTAFDRIGPLRTDLSTGANIDWIARALPVLRLRHVDEVVFERRIHGQNVSLTNIDKHRNLLAVVREHRRRNQ